MKQVGILIVGAGVLALTLARELVSRGFDNILILEKEAEIARHASGRNSGVLHAGIYYGADSLKAKYCLAGNLKMQDYCRANDLALDNCGKVIVAKNTAELESLDVLFGKAQANGAKVDMVDEQQLADIEPWAKTCERAIYSHHTAVVDPKQIMQCLYHELLATKKVKFLFEASFLSLKSKCVAITTVGEIEFNSLINAAGSYADIVAKQFGLSQDYFMMPFKGIYRQLVSTESHRLRGNIYPVPNPKTPFLGVHFTRNIHGDIYAGPTAIPAFGRENYGVLAGMDFEAFSIIGRSAKLFLQNKQFRGVALTEPRKYFSGYFYRCAKALVKELKKPWLLSSPKAGIRPQLINAKTGQLVMDFLVEETDNSLHLLNAISPAFTSSMAVAEDVANRIQKKWNS